MENAYREANGGSFDKRNDALLSKQQALDLMSKCIELAQYRDCLALPDVRFFFFFFSLNASEIFPIAQYQVMIIDAQDGIINELSPKPAIGKWKTIAEQTLSYEK